MASAVKIISAILGVTKERAPPPRNQSTVHTTGSIPCTPFYRCVAETQPSSLEENFGSRIMTTTHSSDLERATFISALGTRIEVLCRDSNERLIVASDGSPLATITVASRTTCISQPERSGVIEVYPELCRSDIFKENSVEDREDLEDELPRFEIDVPYNIPVKRRDRIMKVLLDRYVSIVSTRDPKSATYRSLQLGFGRHKLASSAQEESQGIYSDQPDEEQCYAEWEPTLTMAASIREEKDVAQA